MRAVIDTNVVLSALLWGGVPGKLIDHVRDGSITFVSSPALLAELAKVMARPKFDAILRKSQTSRTQALADIQLLAETIDPPSLTRRICRDPDDDAVLALAIAAKVDLIISGDDDLLTLASFEGVQILSPAQALKTIGHSP